MEYTVSNRMSTIKGSAIREIFKYAADPEVISLGLAHAGIYVLDVDIILGYNVQCA